MGQGLYVRDSTKRIPFLEVPMVLDADARRPHHARCDTSPVVIVQIRLACLDDSGSPARVAYTALEAYYPADSRCNLVYVDVPYNLLSVEDSKAHLAATQKALKVLDR